MLDQEITALSPNTWHGAWMNRQHLMWAMKEFAPVLYVEEPSSLSRKRRPSEPLFSSTVEPVDPRLAVLRLPKRLGRRGADGRWNRFTLKSKSRVIRRHVGSKPRVLYLWHPELWPYVDLLQPEVVVYHLYDLDPEYLDHGARGRTAELFQRACQEADVVLAGTPQQAARMPRDDVHIFPNGVAATWYEGSFAEPADLCDVPHPRIGYVGTISEKLDLAWLEELSRIEEWQLILVGPLRGSISRERFEALLARKNVRWLGEKASRDVPRYMRALDVGLMGYRRGTHMEVASPLKLFEYCAAEAPIVSSRLPSLVANPGAQRFVEFVDAPHEAVDAVAKILKDPPTPADRLARREFAAANSWAVRARTVWDLIAAKRRDSVARPGAWRSHASVECAAVGERETSACAAEADR